MSGDRPLLLPGSGYATTDTADLDVEGESREDVAAGARRRHVVVRHRRVAERRVDVQHHLVGVGDYVVAVAQARQPAHARLGKQPPHARAHTRLTTLCPVYHTERPPLYVLISVV